MQQKYILPRKPSKARVSAAQGRYRRSADALLAVTSALEAHGIFDSAMTAEFDLICATRDRALGLRHPA